MYLENNSKPSSETPVKIVALRSALENKSFLSFNRNVCNCIKNCTIKNKEETKKDE